MRVCQLGFLRRYGLISVLAIVLTGCASVETAGPVVSDITHTAWARSVSPAGSRIPWTHQTFPGKRASSYQYERKDGRDALMVRAASSASMLRQMVRVEPERLGHLRFSWMVPALIEAADLAHRDGDDSPVRVVLAFAGDRVRFSAKDAALSEMSELLTGEPLPYATLMYVWCNQCASGTVIHNPRTSRIRKLVMETGAGRLNRWLDYERDVRADFVKAFGEPPGDLLAIGIMTDTDNTRSQTQAWYGTLEHRPRRAQPQTALAD